MVGINVVHFVDLLACGLSKRETKDKKHRIVRYHTIQKIKVGLRCGGWSLTETTYRIAKKLVAFQSVASLCSF